jgi:hypothetical protein
MFFEVETGHVDLLSVGKNGCIRRGGKKIPVPSAEERARLVSSAHTPGGRSRLEKFMKEFPRLEEGDAVVSGSRSRMYVEITYNKGKEKPIDDYRARASRTVFLGPNSEAHFSGFESWDSKNEKTRERHYGQLARKILLKKGFFLISLVNTEEEVLSPLASISARGGNGSCLLEVRPDAIYCCPIKSSSSQKAGIEFRNLRTGSSFLAKSNTFEEIIVTKSSIYRKGLTKMDEVFKYAPQLVAFLQGTVHESLPQMDTKETAKRMKEMPATLEKNLAGIETLKNMSPEDLERLMKMSGAKVTPKMMERIKDAPKMLRMMEKRGTEAELRKASDMGKAYLEGLGGKNIERMANIHDKAARKLKTATRELAKIGGRSIADILEHPIKHDPLTKKFGAVKVG